MKVIGEVEGQALIINQEGGIFKYYLSGNPEPIGVYDPKSMEENILFLENTKENELSDMIKEGIEKILDETNIKEYALTHKPYEEKDIEQLVDELSIKDGKITRVAELDLDQKIPDDEKESEKENEEEEKEKDEEEENKEIKLSTTKDINIKQELDLSNKTTDMKNLGQLLKKEGKIPNDGKDYTKLAIVESDDVSNIKTHKGTQAKENTTRYQFVLVASDKTVVPINLEPDTQEQSNPTERTYQIMQTGEVQKNAVLSRYKLGNGTLAIDNEAYGEIKAYYSQGKTLGGEGIEGNLSLDTQLETNNVWEVDKDERDRAGHIGEGYRQTEDAIQEIDGTSALQAIKTDDNRTDIIDSNMNIHEGIVNANVLKKDNYIKVFSETEMKYYDFSGNEITYKSLFPNNNLYASQSDGKWGLVNNNGTVVVPYEYDMVTEQNGNVAGVKKDGVWQVVDTNGQIVSDGQFNLSWLDVTFLGGYYKVNNSTNGTVFSGTVRN